MAVLTLILTESPVQVVAGIPLNVSVSTNLPATIFYTLDGSEPTINSDIYLEPIILPTNAPSATLKVFATDGTNTSTILTKEYYSATFGGGRRQYNKIINQDIKPLPGPALFPFGTDAPAPNTKYGKTAGITVDSTSVAGIPDGYDGTATNTHVNETDLPLTSYKMRYSPGTLPAQVSIVVPPAPPQHSNANRKLFNPKALVIIQDGREPPADPDRPILNRQFFFLENPELARDGTNFSTTALDGAVPTGSLVRQHYNPREQTITYYYFDSRSTRWIISKEPYTPKASEFTLSEIVHPSSESGSKYVYKWIPFKGSRII